MELIEVIPQPNLVVIESPVTSTVEVIAIGPQGPESAKIVGFEAQVSNIQPGDLLVFNGNSWVNENKTKLSDGGNF